MGKVSGKITFSIFFICLFYFTLSKNLFSQDSLPKMESFLLGEQLFLGNSEKFDSSYSCVSCHYLEAIDTFNWNSSAFEIADSFADKEIADYEEVLLYAMAEKMFIDHEGAENLSEPDFYALKAYLKYLKEKGPPQLKVFPTKLFFFGVTLILFFFLIVSGIFFRKVKIRYFHRLFLMVILIFWSVYFYPEIVSIGLQKNYEPDQPIKFSHKTHSTQNGTACIYCHPAARYSSSAGMPGVNVCMNCHALVREGLQSGEKEIKKLIAASEQGNALRWIRLNNLPEHVQFSHALHYEVGKIDCIECHGKVENYNRLLQVEDLSMGWCLDCHETKMVKMQENGFYQTFKAGFNGVQTVSADSTSVKNLGGWDCMNCHY